MKVNKRCVKKNYKNDRKREKKKNIHYMQKVQNHVYNLYDLNDL